MLNILPAKHKHADVNNLAAQPHSATSMAVDSCLVTLTLHERFQIHNVCFNVCLHSSRFNICLCFIFESRLLF